MASHHRTPSPGDVAVAGSVMTRSGPALTWCRVRGSVESPIGMPMAASELAGASAVLPALRAHTLMMYEPAAKGLHVKEAFVDHAFRLAGRAIHDDHLNCTGARASSRDSGERDGGSGDLRRSVAGRNARHAQRRNPASLKFSFEYGLTSPAVSYERIARKYFTNGSGSKKTNVVTLPTSIVVVY